MASMQCYRSCSETCETKHHGNSSLTHKVSDMVGKVLHGGNQQQPYAHHHNANQPPCHGQSLPVHHRNSNQPLCHGQSLPMHHHNSNQALCHGQSLPVHHHNNNHHQMGQYGPGGGLTPANCGTGGYGGYGSHGHHNNACSTDQYGNVHKATMKAKHGSRAHRNHNKHRDGNRSCSDASSGSDSD